ncbi:hypothetical protein A8144_11820 [Mycobacterium leprae 3125609]|nr:hypothetical protein A8144_11820 [Mycobacterium leprae 3125609]OAX70562.1 hypothetical protein A3216_11285 [Mycobacterium leprae 7935681]
MILGSFRRDDKVAVITGDDRDLDAAIVVAFAETDTDVVIASRTQSALDAVAEQVRSAGRRSTHRRRRPGISQHHHTPGRFRPPRRSRD